MLSKERIERAKELFSELCDIVLDEENQSDPTTEERLFFTGLLTISTPGEKAEDGRVHLEMENNICLSADANMAKNLANILKNDAKVIEVAEKVKEFLKQDL